MKSYKFYLALIAVLISASYLNAGLDSWISSILPEPMRVSEKNRNLFDQARTVMGIKRPAIIRNAVLPEETVGRTLNAGPFSIVYINEYKYPELTQTIHHETGHIYHNHEALTNGSMFAGRALFGMALFAFMKKAVVPARFLIKASLGALATNLLSVQSDSIEKTRIREREADRIGISAMAKAGHTDLLNEHLETLEIFAQQYGHDAEYRSEAHPTVSEEIAMIRAALDKNAV